MNHRVNGVLGRWGAFLLVAAIFPACGGSGSGGGGDSGAPGPFVPSVILRADLDTAGIPEIFATDLAGSQQQNLSGPLAAGGSVLSFAWSPDHRWVAFLADKDTLGVQELYVAPAAGGSPPVKMNGALVAGGVVSDYQWAPNSQSIAYRAVQLTLGREEIFVTQRDGTGNVRVSSAAGTPGSTVQVLSGPAWGWAPDGSRIAYSADFAVLGTYQLYTVLPDGTGGVQVSTAASGVYKFGWSPSSANLAYTTSSGGGTIFELHSTVPTSSAQDKTLTSTLVNNLFTDWAWSPSGTLLALKSKAGGPVELYTCPPDGSAPPTKVSGTMVAGGAVQDYFWSPDSSRIAYRANQSTSSLVELYTSPAATSTGNVKVSGTMVAGGTVAPPNTAPPAWSPDSTQIAYLATQAVASTVDLYVSPGTTSTGNLRLAYPGVSSTGGVRNFAWAPDQSRIALTGDLNVTNYVELFTVIPSAPGAVRINGPLQASGLVTAFQWTGDSSKVAYSADQETANVYELYVSFPATALGNLKISGPHVPSLNPTTLQFATQ